MPARGSMGATTTRLFITSISTTCAACFIACATAPASPFPRWKARLPGASGQIAGAPAASAALPSTTAGQRLVVDLYELGRFARDLLAVGNDEGHRVADMAHAAHGQRRPRRHDQRLHRRHAGQRPESVGGEIGSRVNALHAGQRRAPRNVDPLDERMGVRRAQNMAVQGGRSVDVGDVAAAADKKS